MTSVLPKICYILPFLVYSSSPNCGNVKESYKNRSSSSETKIVTLEYLFNFFLR